MRPFLVLYTALALHYTGVASAASVRYGEWLLEQPRSSVLTLSFKQSISLDNKITTSELGFVCDQTDKSIGVILIPFEGAFENNQRVIPVLIEKNSDRYDSSDLLQHWQNETEYIFAESKDESKRDRRRKICTLFFPNDADAGPQISNHTVISVSGFSDGFSAFQAACAASR